MEIKIMIIYLNQFLSSLLFSPFLRMRDDKKRKKTGKRKKICCRLCLTTEQTLKRGKNVIASDCVAKKRGKEKIKVKKFVADF